MILLILRTFICFLKFLITLGLQLASLIVLPMVLPFIPQGVEVLPTPVAWFDNYSGRLHPYPVGDGLSGDPAYRAARASAGHTNLFWERYLWLGIRNPVNYFQYVVLGYKNDAPVTEFSSVGPAVGNQSMGGFQAITAKSPTQGRVYEYYWVKPYTLRGNRVAFVFRIGYKFTDLHQLETDPYTQFVFDIIPWREYTGV